jgi:NitT/TauT family transport system permease protein
VLPPLVAGLLAGIGWELYIEITNESKFVLPRPTAALDALFSDLGRFGEEGASTLWVSLAGLALGTLVASSFAVLMAHSVTLERALLPIAIMVKVTPIVALAPLFVIWFGFGWEPKVAIAALIAYFPVLINTIVGLRDVDPHTLDFLRSVNASRREVFWSLRVPSALPFLFAALKISATLSLIGAVVAEFFSAQQGGLGAVISIEQRNLQLDEVFAAIIALTVIGVMLNTAIVVAERLTLSWHQSTLTAAG